MKSVLVIGLGRFGRHFAQKLLALHNDVMIVDSNAEIINSLAAEFTDSCIGDCTREDLIASLGVRNFDICMVAIGEDFQSSLVITSLLKKHGAPYVIAKANQAIQEDLLRTIGADQIVYPEREIAEKLAVRCTAQNVFDCIDLTDQYALYELPVPAGWVGHDIGSLNIRRKYHVNIVGVKRDGVLQPIPGADYVFAVQDHMIVIGEQDDLQKLNDKI